VDVLTAPRATTLCPAIQTFEEKDRGSFVDSFNLDSRSARLNAEMGLVIDAATDSRLSRRCDASLKVNCLAWPWTNAFGREGVSSSGGLR